MKLTIEINLDNPYLMDMKNLQKVFAKVATEVEAMEDTIGIDGNSATGAIRSNNAELYKYVVKPIN